MKHISVYMAVDIFSTSSKEEYKFKVLSTKEIYMYTGLLGSEVSLENDKYETFNLYDLHSISHADILN